MNCNITLENDIQPKSAAIFYENGVPYIKYVGTSRLSDGTVVEIEIPKMSLTIKGIENNIETIELYKGFKTYEKAVTKQEILVETNNYFFIKPIERTCTKKQLEKELGYKLNIQEE